MRHRLLPWSLRGLFLPLLLLLLNLCTAPGEMSFVPPLYARFWYPPLVCPLDQVQLCFL
ncbi:hypothetical protein BDM02DRAFT_3108990 [Thelephora ganbajun]|uniref:Uncharacterized protein n=1 Tax=Thelephora ganbajun TaxID=370292 RepID=A0ACB6ZSQ5_THEGA|nr:hypothetical protein BDM02DRAFT_3108990 [Thelephora ganbajun]